MDSYSRLALVGDIGGTFITFGIADIDGLSVDHFALLSSADFADPLHALDRYLASVPRCPDMVALAVAGPQRGDSVTMSHRPWTINRADVQALTGASRVVLLNDVEALALALPHLIDYDLVAVGDGIPAPNGTKVVINAGTGLGVGALVWAGNSFVTLGSRGGQVTFAAPQPGEFDVRRALGTSQVSAEDVFTGQGLVALYNALAGSFGQDAVARDAPQITKLGLSGSDAAAAEAVRLMAAWFARFAGDVALLTAAEGGVYLAGKLASSIVPAIDPQRFRAEFESKGRAAPYLRSLAVSVIKTGADAGLRGAAIALARSLPSAEPNFRAMQRA